MPRIHESQRATSVSATPLVSQKCLVSRDRRAMTNQSWHRKLRQHRRHSRQNFRRIAKSQHRHHPPRPANPANGARKSSIAPRDSVRVFSTAILIASFQNTKLTSGAINSPNTGTRNNRNIGNGFSSGNTAGDKQHKMIHAFRKSMRIVNRHRRPRVMPHHVPLLKSLLRLESLPSSPQASPNASRNTECSGSAPAPANPPPNT